MASPPAFKNSEWIPSMPGLFPDANLFIAEIISDFVIGGIGCSSVVGRGSQVLGPLYNSS